MAKYRFDQVARECRTTFKGDKNGMPIVGLEHLVPNEMLVRDFEVDTENTFTKSFKQGQILFGRRRAYQQKAGVAQFDGICSGDITIIEAIPGKIEPNLLPFIVQNEQFFEHAVQGSAGSLSPRVKWEHLASYEIELPTMEKQRVLADKLWTAYRLKESYKKLLAATDEMVKSQFIEMFGNCLQVEKLSSLCDTFLDGDWIESKDQSDEGIRLVQTGNVGNGIFKNKEEKCRFISDKTFDRLHCTEIFSGDILVSRLPDPIGRACMIPNGLGRMITAVDCSIIRLKESILPDFFIAYTMTPTYRAQINEVTTGTTRRRVSRANLGNVKVPVPPMEQQQQFVSIAHQADKSKFVGFKSQFIEMFGERTTTPVGYYIKDSFPGDWGKEDLDGTGVKVIRTTNFTNFGKLNLSEVVTRSIEERKIQKKQILKYDTILERSGGTADNPVGRVVLFEEDEQYLCNNFTQVLRFKDIDPRFAFYALFYFYQMNKTSIRSMGSKTTGIQNLNMSKYLEIGIPNADEDEQKQFVSIAEQADKSKLLHRTSIKYSKYSL